MPTRTPTRALSQQDEPVNIKLLVLGIASVGKSSLLLRFTDQQWLPEEETNPTIGVDTLVSDALWLITVEQVVPTCHVPAGPQVGREG